MPKGIGRALSGRPGRVPGLAGSLAAAAGSLRQRLSRGAFGGHRALTTDHHETVPRAASRLPDTPAPSDGTQLVDSLPHLSWRADAHGRMVWLNARWRNEVELAEGACWRDAVHPDDRAGVEQAWAEGLRRGEPFEFEARLRTRPAGAHRWYHARACPLGGGSSGWCGTFSDVDAQRRREAGLHAAERRKEEFLTVLGHELRNPLAAIRNALQITTLREATPEQSGAARRVVERQIGHMVRLIDDLLDVNRVVSGQIVLRRQALDLREPLRAAVEARRPVSEERRQRLTLELPDEPVVASADRSRLEQVFANLLGNASKYSERGTAIHVSLAHEGELGVVRFRDEGVGIGADDLLRVFEPFVQLDPARARSDGGLGIGLTLVRHLVELHGGRVEASSEGPGCGSVFSVRLPAPARAVDGQEHAAARPLYRSRPSVGRRILVVDDNVDSAQSLATMLQIQGHDVRTANDGIEGLRVADAFHPEVVLLDLGMPRMNGFDTARCLRNRPWATNVLLLALTGWSHDEDRARSREAGFDDHLVKPVDPELLTRVLRSASVTGRAAAGRL